MSKVHAVLIVVIFLGLTCGVFYGAWYVTLSGLKNKPTTDEWKNFYSLAGVGLAATSGVMGAWISFRNLGAQAKTSADVERVKKVLEKSIPAYGTLFAAAYHYYRALAPLETGGFNPEVIEGAEGKMKEAEGDILFVSDEYAKLWYDIWGNARFAKEKANRDAHTVDDRRKLWHEQCKALGLKLSEMKQLAQMMLRH